MYNLFFKMFIKIYLIQFLKIVLLYEFHVFFLNSFSIKIHKLIVFMIL